MDSTSLHDLVQEFTATVSSAKEEDRQLFGPLVELIIVTLQPGKEESPSRAYNGETSIAQRASVLVGSLSSWLATHDSLKALSNSLEADFRANIAATARTSPEAGDAGAQSDTQPQAAMRQFFIEHFALPFPTREEKEQLLAETNAEISNMAEHVSDQSLTLWFINIRRRSGWTPFFRKYANSRYDFMAEIVECLQAEEKEEGEEQQGSAQMGEPRPSLQDVLDSIQERIAQGKSKGKKSASAVSRAASRNQQANGHSSSTTSPAKRESVVSADECRDEYEAIIESVSAKAADRVGGWLAEVVEAAKKIKGEVPDDEESSIDPDLKEPGTKRKKTQRSSISGPSVVPSNSGSSTSRRMSLIDASTSVTSPTSTEDMSISSGQSREDSEAVPPAFSLSLPSHRFMTSSARQPDHQVASLLSSLPARSSMHAPIPAINYGVAAPMYAHSPEMLASGMVGFSPRTEANRHQAAFTQPSMSTLEPEPPASYFYLYPTDPTSAALQQDQAPPQQQQTPQPVGAFATPRLFAASASSTDVEMGDTPELSYQPAPDSGMHFQG